MASALARLVDELTTSGEPRLDAAKMRALKRECRASEEQLDCAYRLLMAQLSRAHAQVRLSTFQAMEQLFARSHHFRSLLVSDFQDFLALTLGTEHARPLPPPRETAQRLKRAALQAVQGWVAKYGPAYKKLELGFHFLRHNKQVDFQDVDVRTLAERKRAEEKQKRLERIYKERAEQAASDMEEMSEEIRCCLTEVDSCFRLLVPFDLAEASRQSGEATPAPEEEEQPCCSKSLPPCAPCLPVGAHQTASKPASEDSDGDEDGEENPVLEDGDGGLNGFVRCHGLGSYKYTLQVELCADSLRVQEDENNQAIVHSARDALKLIQNKFLPAVGSWVQLFTRAGARAPLEDAIRLKVELEAMLRRGHELAIQPDVPSGREAASEDEDEDFVEVPEKEGYEPCIPDHLRPEYGLEAAQGSQMRKDEEAQDPTSAAAQPHSLRGRVPPGARAARGPQEAGSLAVAPVPVVPFGLDLCYWGQEPPSSRVPRADPEHRFWRPLELEADGQADGQLELRSSRHITFAGTFQPVQHRCRAPKPDGQLCERQDRLKCPFHGKIIPRDEVGQPLHPDDRAREQKLQEQRRAERPGWKDPEFLRDVEAATGVDLGSAHGRGRGRGRRRKHPGLADLKCQANTSRARLAKKVLAKASVQRVAAAMNKMDQKKHEKFQNQFNYALK